MRTRLGLLTIASWFLPYGTSLGTGKPLALDAVLLLIHPLSSRCRGRGRTRGDEGAGLLRPCGGRTRGSSLSVNMSIRALCVSALG